MLGCNRRNSDLWGAAEKAENVSFQTLEIDWTILSFKTLKAGINLRS